MKLISVKPVPKLRPYIKEFWYTTIISEIGAQSYQIIGDGATGIIFQHSGGHSAVVNAANEPLPLSFAYGQSVVPCQNQIVDSAFVFGVRFKPTAFKTIFGIDAYELTNSILELTEHFEQSFDEYLLEAQNPHVIIHLFESQLLKLLDNRTVHKGMIAAAQRIVDQPINVNVKTLSEFVNLSERQFQRQFKVYTGVNPQTYIRVAKMQRAIHRLKQQDYHKLSDVGYDLHYADQSHFSREFKQFTGITPKAFVNTMKGDQPFIKAQALFEPVRIIRTSA